MILVHQRGDTIDLLNNHTYVINGLIYLNKSLNLGNFTSIIGNNAMTDRLVYLNTGSTLISRSTSNMIRNVQFNSPYGSVYDFINTAQTNTFYAINTSHLGCNNLGYLNGYYGLYYINNLYSQNQGTIELYAPKTLVFANTIWEENTGTSISISGSPITQNTKVNLIGNIFESESATTSSTINIIDSEYIQYGLISNNIFPDCSCTTISGILIWSSPKFAFYNNVGIDNELAPPTLSSDEIFNFNEPDIGSIVYDTNEKALNYYNGDNWVELNSTIKGINLFSDNFESGDFTSSGWTVANDTTNQWHVGVDQNYEGTYGAYISNDGGTTAQYNIETTNISHIYKDIYIPTGITSNEVQIQVNFYWKCFGEVPAYDYGKVYWVPNTGTTVNPGTQINSTYAIGKSYYNVTSISEVEWRTESIAFNGTGGTTQRLAFSWINDASVGNNPPFCIDNVNVKYIPR